MSLPLKVVAQYQTRVALAKPFDAMLDALEPEGGLDYTSLKKFAQEFAQRLSKIKLPKPVDVQNAAREAAKAIGSPTKRVFNVMALQLGMMVADAWKRASAPQGAKGGMSFIEGFQDTLKRKAPLSDREWADAIEYGLGWAEGELGVRL